MYFTVSTRTLLQRRSRTSGTRTTLFQSVLPVRGLQLGFAEPPPLPTLHDLCPCYCCIAGREECVGSGHAALALRSDWQQQLARTSRDLGVKRVRFHGILDDDVGGRWWVPLAWRLWHVAQPPPHTHTPHTCSQSPPQACVHLPHAHVHRVVHVSTLVPPRQWWLASPAAVRYA